MEMTGVPATNNPVSDDGRATERSVQQRIEDKIFGKAEAPKEAPKPAQEPQEAAPDTQAQDTIPGAQEAVDETEEVEFEGDKYLVPKKLKPALDGYKDYTVKTMTAADRQRHADLIIEQSRQAQAMQSAVQPKYDSLNEIRRNIASYERVDWNTWIATNPVEAQKGMLQLQVLRDQERKADGELQMTVKEQMELINQTRAKLKEENEKVLARSIKDWNADKAKGLTDFAGKTYGFSEQELSAVFDSRVWQMVNDAQQWRSLQASKPQMKKVVAASPTLKPGATEQKNAAQVKQASLKREIRTAKTDHDKAKGIQKLLESRLN